MLAWKGTTLGRAVGHRVLQNSRRWSHSLALPPPLERAMELNGNEGSTATTPQTPTLIQGWGSKQEEVETPSHFGYFGVGPMELMAVPKKKVSRHKKGIRNGPKALKPVPVIIRCRSCGRVKLPHFYCCSGDRGSSESNNSSG